MAITLDGIFVNGQKATFHPEDILSGDASAYTEEIGTAVEAWMEENVTGGEQVTDTTLTLPGVPADAKKTGDEIGALKEVLDTVYDVALDGKGISATIRNAAFTSQKITYWDTGAWRIAYIPCEPGKAYHITKDIDTTKFDIAYATEPLALDTPVYGFISLQGTARESIFIPGSGATFLLVQTQGNISHVTFSEYVGKYDDDIVGIKADIDVLNNVASETTKSKYVEIDETNIEPSLTFKTGYMAKTGVVQTSGITTLEYSNKIEVAPTNIIRFAGEPFRFVCAFNGDTAVEAKGAESTKEYIIPDGIDHVVLTRYKSDDGVAINLIETELRYFNVVNQIPMGYLSEAGSMSAGDKLYLPTHNVKNKNRYVFNANITSFSAIKFAKDDSLVVNDTNIVVTNSNGTTTIPHGLTISHDITLIIENEESYTASLIRVASAGNVFSYTTAIRFLMDENAPYIESQGSTLTECRFSWVSENINQPIWLFGDSYFSWYDARWTYYAAEDGYLESSLLNGYAGQAAASAMTALINLLQITTPKMVVWCLGMNNGDDSAVNASWYTNYQKLIELSEQYDFEIVLYTTPTTPTIDNSYKNAIVRESGYRYIEADKAVRIDNEGHWVTGALSGDNVHPTAIGAKILYYRILADLPEIMSK